MRLKAAFDALRDPHQASLTIQDIARKAGYDSDAFFCRAFKSMFDVTPGELRRAAEMAAPKFAPQPGVDRRYEAWLHSRVPPLPSAGQLPSPRPPSGRPWITKPSGQAKSRRSAG